MVTEPGLGQAALVDDVVVEDQMDATGPAIGVQQRAQQVEEQPGRLAVAGDVDQPLVGGIVGAGQMTLLVLPGRHHFPLGAGQHPVGTDLGVEVEIDLVHVEHHLARPPRVGETAQRRDPGRAVRGFPRAAHNGTRRSPAHPQPPQDLPQVTDRELDLQHLLDHSGEQLEGPGRARKAEVGWALLQDLADPGLDVVDHLGPSVLAPTVHQRGFPMSLETRYDAHCGRGNAADLTRGRVPRHAGRHLQQHATAHPEFRIAGLAVQSPQPQPGGTLDSTLHRETSLSLGVVSRLHPRNTRQVSRFQWSMPTNSESGEGI